MLLARPLGVHELEHLDLVELVDAEDAARVLAGRAGLAPEAGREARVAERQVVLGEDLVGVQRGEADLRRADQEEVVARDLVDLGAIGREEARSRRARPRAPAPVGRPA